MEVALSFITAGCVPLVWCNKTPPSGPSNSSRPGRPPKRTQSVTSPENPHIMPHSVPGLMSPGMIPPTGLTAAAAAAANAAIAEAMKVKKIKLEAMSGYHGNANHHGPDGENGDLSSSVGLELPFMMMPHPLIPVSLPPASVTMAMSQMNHLSTIANMAAAAQGQSLPSRMVTSVIKGLQEQTHSTSQWPVDEPCSSRPVPNIPPGPKEGDLAHDMSHEVKRMHADKEDNPLCTPTARDSYERLSLAGQGLPPGFPSPFLFPDGLSSIETLLTNIQGLLKVAIDNARAQEKQVQLEKTELKMELFREREVRETLEKQLAMEQKNRAIIQKRLKKEKKAKRKLQEALEYESKRREQVEQTLKQPSPSDSMRSLNDALTPEMESDRSSARTDAERTIQDGRLFLKTTVIIGVIHGENEWYGAAKGHKPHADTAHYSFGDVFQFFDVLWLDYGHVTIRAYEGEQPQSHARVEDGQSRADPAEDISKGPVVQVVRKHR
ncbi:hypothetical protein WMY93_028540 [Mugilogobius chulae]|uniref:Uncharacterized protein n=1 Tax=Mugilogobius chulae TaxID=88201 RepID=A0AAW0MT35_9GOBI